MELSPEEHRQRWAAFVETPDPRVIERDYDVNGGYAVRSTESREVRVTPQNGAEFVAQQTGATALTPSFEKC
jgi:hypothetical protein